MFGLFKKKDSNGDKQGNPGDEAWGLPPKSRKLSKDEAARDAAEQQLSEQRNRERRDMYRHPGNERMFEDVDGRRLALRVEENEQYATNPLHPPVQVIAFWGAKELGSISAMLDESGNLHQLKAKIEYGFENRGVAQELLKELEEIARRKGASEVVCAGLEGNEWSANFLSGAGYARRENSLVKSL